MWKRMNKIGDMTEPCGTPALKKCGLERQPSTLTAMVLLTIRQWTCNSINNGLVRTKHRRLRKMIFTSNQSMALKMSREVTLFSPRYSRPEDQIWSA